jgi:GNAT superfamily N-acetyltransferase
MTTSVPAALVEFDARRLDELVRIWRASFELGVGITDPHPIEEQRRYFLAEVLPRHAVRMALRGTELVGFIAASTESVSQLFVRVGHQRQGIGAALLAWAKSRSGGSLWLYAFKRNHGACAFYERNGFVAIAHGFEPTWQLEDIKYQWPAGPTCGPTPATTQRRTS